MNKNDYMYLVLAFLIMAVVMYLIMVKYPFIGIAMMQG